MKFAVEVECYGPAPDEQLSRAEIEQIWDAVEQWVTLRVQPGWVVRHSGIVDLNRLRYKYEREQMLHASCQGLLDGTRAELQAALQRVRALEQALGNLAAAGELE